MLCVVGISISELTFGIVLCLNRNVCERQIKIINSIRKKCLNLRRECVSVYVALVVIVVVVVAFLWLRYDMVIKWLVS